MKKNIQIGNSKHLTVWSPQMLRNNGLLIPLLHRWTLKIRVNFRSLHYLCLVVLTQFELNGLTNFYGV